VVTRARISKPHVLTRLRQNIAATALFLANKTEENCRKTKDIIVAVARVAQKDPKLVIDEQSKEYWRWRDSILMYEELMLEILTFDLTIDNPYQRLFELLSQLEMVHNRPLRHAAWGFCNDACLTSLPLHMEARDVAIAAIFFASIHTKQNIDDVSGEPWYRVLSCDEEKCCGAVDLMYNFYLENPLQKQNPSMPSPPYKLDSTRKTGDPLHGSQTPSAATPLDMDRSTQSPRPRANGAGADAQSSQATIRPESTTAKDKTSEMPGSLTPSMKRRGGAGDSDLESEAARRPKRSRVSGEDEGEIIRT
jgi:protein BUR2